MATVIVFGPTGNVGSVTARTAQQHGAKVVLAMRDPSKKITGLSEEEEKKGGYERVQADLTKPDTVAEAVKKTGATRAFVYASFGAQDHMKSIFEALKSAGVDFVVFLSSFTVHGDKSAFTQDQLIPWVHAQTEISLDAVYGEDNYVAIRPGGFATNLLAHKDGIASGEVRVFGPDFAQDHITYEDMGNVSGVVLAEGPRNGQKKVYLYGPEMRTVPEAVEVISQVLGKETKVVEIDEDEGREQFKQRGVPPPAAEYMIRELKKKDADGLAKRANYEEGVKNVGLYTGRSSMGLKEWVQANKELFA